VFGDEVPRQETVDAVDGISNALKGLGLRSRNFLAQLVSETSRACTIWVRRSSLGRLLPILGPRQRVGRHLAQLVGDLEHKSVQGTDAALDPDKYD